MGGKNSYESIKRYEDKAYDKVLVRMPKGRKDEIQTFAAQTGESVNGFINRAISETLERETRSLVKLWEKAHRSPQERRKARGLSLPLPHLKRRRRPHREPGKRFPRLLAVRLKRRRNATRLCKQ